MIIDLGFILSRLSESRLHRMDFGYTYQDKMYRVKAYKVGKIIRIDITEAKEEE